VHAVIHQVVENQIASECEPVVRAMERLMREGLTRHEAVPAVGSIVAERLFELMTTQPTMSLPPNRAMTRLWRD